MLLFRTSFIQTHKIDSRSPSTC